MDEFVEDARLHGEELSGKDKMWMRMNVDEQAAAAVLGYNAASWDAGATPPACTQLWKELRRQPAQLAAAQTLGYTESDWDAELHAVELPARPPPEVAAATSAPPRSGGSFAVAPASGDGVWRAYNGTVLILSDKSGTGYKGVCQRGENRFAVTFHGKCEGSFATAVEAAVKYKELVSAEGGEDAEEEPPAAPAAAAAKPSAVPSAVASSRPGSSQGGKAAGAKAAGKPMAPPPPPKPAVAAAASSSERPPIATKSCGLKLHLSPGSHTGYKGVGKQNSGSGKQYQAHLGHGPGSSLGYFATAVEAAVAYARKVKALREAAASALKAGGGKGAASSAPKGGGAKRAKAAAEPSSKPPPAKRPKEGGKASKAEEEEEEGADGDGDGDGEGEEAAGAAEEAAEAEAEFEDQACNKCGRTGDAFRMLLCDGPGCTVAQHTYCCDPPLHVAPAGDWFCFGCSLKSQPTHQLTGRQQMKYLQQLEEARIAEEQRKVEEEARQAELAKLPAAARGGSSSAATSIASGSNGSSSNGGAGASASGGGGGGGGGSSSGGGQRKRKAEDGGSGAARANGPQGSRSKAAAVEEGDDDDEGGSHAQRSYGPGMPPYVPPVPEAGGLKLFLSEKSNTGYLKVSTEASDHKKTNRFRAFRIAHPKQGCFIGRYATATDAAVEVARDIRQRGIPRRTLQAALDRGLKGQELIDAVEAARSKAAAKAKARSSKANGEADAEGADEDDEE